MSEIRLIIDSVPVPWAAHQGFGRRSFNPRFKEKEYYQWKIKQKFSDKPFECPIRIQVFYMLPIPKSASKKKRIDMINNNERHTKKPDIDNLNKFLNDCLKEIVFVDDNQVFEMFSYKCYGEEPKTIVKIFPMV